MRTSGWRHWVVAGVTAVTAVAVVDATQQAPASAPPPTAVLAGQVVDAVTGAPVANTMIGVSQRARSGPNTTPTAPNTQLVTVMTDSRGRFVVRDIPQGSFLLLATAPGYIVSNYGQARPGGPTRTIDLAAGERRVDLKVPLWRHGVISGEVLDEAGEPVVGVIVRVLRRSPNGAGGQPRYIPGTQTVTDDQGRYRLTALSPGQFLVTVPQTQVTVPASVVDAYVQGGGLALLDLMNTASAVPSAGGGVRVEDLLLQSSAGARLTTVPPPTNGLLVYPTTIATSGDPDHPDISVNAGQERSGVNLTLRPERTRRITGTVTADGAPLGKVSVRLIRNDGLTTLNQNGYEAAATVSRDDGTFTLLGVPAGEYTLRVLRTPRLQLPATLSANPAIAAAYPPGENIAPLVGAELPLSIGNADVNGLVLALASGATVTGRVVFEGTGPTAPQMQKFGALLASEEGPLPGAGLQIARFDANGAFTLTAPAPGRYSVTVLGPPAAGWRFAGTTWRGVPLAGPLDLSKEHVTDLITTFTDVVGDLTGILTRSTGAPVTSAGIVVFSTDRRAWTLDPLNPRQPQLEQSDRNGSFTINDLLPGDYFVAAIDDADMPEMPDVAFLQRVSAIASRVRVEAGTRQSVTLTIGSLK